MARRALGRGLEALIPTSSRLRRPRVEEDEVAEEGKESTHETPASDDGGDATAAPEMGRAPDSRGAETPAGTSEPTGGGAASESSAPGEDAGLTSAENSAIAPNPEPPEHAGEAGGTTLGAEAARPLVEGDPDASGSPGLGSGAEGADAGRAPGSASGSETGSETGSESGSEPGAESRWATSTRRALASGRASAVIEIAVDRIGPNPYQPRTTFREDELEELERSVSGKGVLQPVLVRRRGMGYELIAGERRLRAARRAGLHSIPSIVREAQDEEMLELALIENQQRVDLDPMEAAEAYSRAMDEFGLNAEELATIVGKDRSTVANLLRLLGLPAEVQQLVRERQLGMGHARALAGVDSAPRAIALARRAARSGMSVRAVEKLAREPGRPPRRARQADPELVRFEERLRERFGTQVRIARRGERGRVEIEFYTRDDLERILDELQVLSQG